MRCFISVVILAAVAISTATAGGSNCAQYDGDCNSCTTLPINGNCGYCADKAQCLDGSVAGPSGVRCTGAWAWDSSQCPATPAPANACANFDGKCGDCMSSLPLGHCGFCSSDKKCRAGNINGPTNDYCNAGWLFDKPTSQCPAPVTPCSTYDGNCESCHAAKPLGRCGYCSTSNKCLAGNDNGPSGDNGYCPTSDWYWDSSVCPTPAPPSPPTPAPSNDCTAFDGNCQGCTNQAPEGNCGFCATTNKCLPGSSEGPNSGTCAPLSWHWFGNNCPVAPSGCQVHKTCGGCVGSSPAGACGFCSGVNKCWGGNVNGPTNHYCTGNWTWDDVSACPAVTPAPPANCHLNDGDCGACVNSNSGVCGYCSSTQKCTQGNATGSLGMTCTGSAWYWDAASCPATPAPTGVHCAANTGCNACTNAASGQCGWCSSSATCSSGTFNGPSSGTCLYGWDWYNADCGSSDMAADME